MATLDGQLSALIEAYERLDGQVQDLDGRVQNRISEFNRALHVELTKPKPEAHIQEVQYIGLFLCKSHWQL